MIEMFKIYENDYTSIASKLSRKEPFEVFYRLNYVLFPDKPIREPKTKLETKLVKIFNPKLIVQPKSTTPSAFKQVKNNFDKCKEFLKNEMAAKTDDFKNKLNKISNFLDKNI